MIAVYRIQKRFRRLAAGQAAATELIWRPSEWPLMLHWGLTEVMGQLIEFQVAGCSVAWQVAGGSEDPMVAWQLGGWPAMARLGTDYWLGRSRIRRRRTG